MFSTLLLLFPILYIKFVSDKQIILREANVCYELVFELSKFIKISSTRIFFKDCTELDNYRFYFKLDRKFEKETNKVS